MKNILLIIFLSLSLQTFSQTHPQTNSQPNSTLPEWVQKMYSPDASIVEVKELYDAYYKTHEFVKNTFTQDYKRWCRDQLRDNNGSLFQRPLDDEKYNQSNYISKSKQLQQQRNNTWTCIGPFDFDKDGASASYAAGSAHVYTTEQAATDSNILYAGSSAAGVFKSIDKGETWQPLTYGMMLNRVRAIEIDNTNADIVYFNGAGKIYKTIDGGATWNINNDAAFQNIYFEVTDIVISPLNHLELWFASDKGLYHTTDGGNNWVQLYNGIWQEIEFNPADPSIMYAIKQTGVKTEFYKSTDYGLTFTIRLGGYPLAVAPDEQKRTEIAVTPIAPNIIYAFATGVANGGSGLYGIYVSHDAGETWTFQCCGDSAGGVPNDSTNLNLCAWSDKGSDDGGQYYYDLALAVSPFDSSEVHVGAVNHWISHDGGATWNCPSKWSHSQKADYVHADIHDIKFYGNQWWLSCDGGIFYSADSSHTWNRKQFGITGTDFWGFGMGEWEGNEVMVGGTYHNGTLLKDFNVYNNGWLSCMGGDNVLGAVNYGYDRIIFSDYGRHKLSGDRNVDLDDMGSGAIPNGSYTTGESGDMEFHPQVYNTIYIGRDSSIWKSEDNGATYHLLYDFGTGLVTSVQVAYSDPNYIYAVYYKSYSGLKKLYRSSDAGITWIDITPASIVFNGSNVVIPFDITVSATNPLELWLVRTQQTSSQSNLNGYKVFKSIDGGASWINITTPTLDGEFITNIVHQRGTDGGVYIGTRRSVYYRNNTMADWALYNAGLPISAYSVDIELDYKTETVTNATERSVWQIPFYESSVLLAQISVNTNDVRCIRDTVYFHDHSTMKVDNCTWQWSFPDGNPSSSTLKNPKVLYSNHGDKSVILIITSSNGTKTQTLNNFIHVSNKCGADSIPGMALQLDGTDGYASVPPLNLFSNTVTMSAWIKCDGVQKNFAGILFSRTSNTCAGLSITDVNELRVHWNGDEWSWHSGLIVPDNEWAFIALVATPTSLTIYLNGVPSVHTGTFDIEQFDSEFRIGQDSYSSNRRFKGLIDEVCIYNRSLSQNEIRELMHLTKKPEVDSTLVAYYQFNESGGQALDKVGSRHASLNNSAIRVTSTGPFGGGVSERKTISATGSNNFSVPQLKIDWATGATVPNGELVVSQIHLFPDVTPTNNWNSKNYWILDNYGINDTVSAPSLLTFNNVGDVNTADVMDPTRFKLFTRYTNADGNVWGNFIDDGNSCNTSGNGTVIFANANTVTLGQFGIVNAAKDFNGIDTNFNSNSQNEYIIYPSLVNNKEFIHIKSLRNEILFVKIYNAAGELMRSEKFNTEGMIYTNDMSAGMYAYTITNGTIEEHGKIILQ